VALYLSQRFYNRQKNADEALNYARKAVEIHSASDTAYFEMAKAYRTQKQLQKSVDATRSAHCDQLRNGGLITMLWG